jgi:hypothetical protein
MHLLAIESVQDLQFLRLGEFDGNVLPNSKLRFDSNGLGDSDRQSAGENVDVARGRNFAAKNDRSIARKVFDAISQVRDAVSSGRLMTLSKSNASKDFTYYRTGAQPDCASALDF